MDCVTSNGVVTLQCAAPLIINLLNWAFGFAGLAALFFVILGGFKFLTSGGDKEKVEGARNTITWSIIGLILIFSSFAILNLIGGLTGVSCIRSGSYKFGRCGLPENTCDGAPPICNNNATPACLSGIWSCGDTGVYDPSKCVKKDDVCDSTSKCCNGPDGGVLVCQEVRGAPGITTCH